MCIVVARIEFHTSTGVVPRTSAGRVGEDSSAAHERGQAEKLGDTPPMLGCPLESVLCIAFSVWNACFSFIGFLIVFF